MKDKYIIEHGLENRTEYAVNGANTTEDLERYLDSNPHPEYRLVTVSFDHSFVLVWELKEKDKQEQHGRKVRELSFGNDY